MSHRAMLAPHRAPARLLISFGKKQRTMASWRAACSIAAACLMLRVPGNSHRELLARDTGHRALGKRQWEPRAVLLTTPLNGFR